MEALKKISVAILWLVFVNLLLLLALTWTLNATFGNREVVKSWFADSGAYDRSVSLVVDELENGIALDAGAQSNPDVAALTEAANNTLTPEVLRDALEKVLDGTYNWLDGTTPNLTFAIDLSAQRDQFINELAGSASQYLATIPECPNAQPINQSDPFSLECRPPGSSEQLIAEFQNQLAASEDFFPDAVLNANDLKVDSAAGEQTIDEALAGAPSWYQQAQFSQWVLVVLALLSAVGTIFLSSHKRTGIRHVATGFAVSALFVALTGFIAARLSDLISGDENSIQMSLVKPITEQIGAGFASWHYRLALLYLACAVICYIVVLIWKKQSPQTLQTTNLATEGIAKENKQETSVAVETNKPQDSPSTEDTPKSDQT